MHYAQFELLTIMFVGICTSWFTNFEKKSQLLEYVFKNHPCQDHNLNLQPTLEMSDKMSISILKQIKGFEVEIGLQCTKTWNKCKLMWTHSHMKWKCARIKEVIPRLSSRSHTMKVENLWIFILWFEVQII